jgi:hypothetical protein
MTETAAQTTVVVPLSLRDAPSRNVSTTLRQWHLDFKLDFLRLALVG